LFNEEITNYNNTALKHQDQTEGTKSAYHHVLVNVLLYVSTEIAILYRMTQT